MNYNIFILIILATVRVNQRDGLRIKMLWEGTPFHSTLQLKYISKKYTPQNTKLFLIYLPPRYINFN